MVPCMPEGVKLGMHELPVSGILPTVGIGVIIGRYS